MKTLTSTQISTLCNQLADSIPNVLRALNIDYVEYENRYAFPCPIHGGDNPEGCCLFKDSEDVVGNWKCWTGNCDQDFAENIFGFIRGCLSFQKGETATLNETYDFCQSLPLKAASESNYSDCTYSERDKLLEIFLKTSHAHSSNITREDIRSRLSIPSQYYLGRGYSEEVLDLFDIGECIQKNQAMYQRVVVPIYDYDYNYVGCVGRSTSDEMLPKWLHSKGFKKQHLYGLNIAKPYILATRTVFLLEGQGDVWRMHEAGYKNAVSIFGASINDDQLLLLEEIGVMNVIILTDSDEAGRKAAKQIQKKCGRRFNYSCPTLSTKDPGDLTIEQLKSELDSQIRG